MVVWDAARVAGGSRCAAVGATVALAVLGWALLPACGRQQTRPPPYQAPPTDAGAPWTPSHDCDSDPDCPGSRCVEVRPGGFRVCEQYVAESLDWFQALPSLPELVSKVAAVARLLHDNAGHRSRRSAGPYR